MTNHNIHDLRPFLKALENQCQHLEDVYFQQLQTATDSLAAFKEMCHWKTYWHQVLKTPPAHNNIR